MVERRGWPVDVHPLPPLLHNQPHLIADEVRRLAMSLAASYESVAVGYADCGTYGALDAVCDGYGIGRSSVSRHWKAASQKQLKELMERPLGDLDLVAMLIDGIEFHGTLIVAAIGFAADGKKHVLGLWQGATAWRQLLLCSDDN